MSWIRWIPLSVAIVAGVAACETYPQADASDEALGDELSAPLRRSNPAGTSLTRYTQGLLDQSLASRARLTLVFVLDGMRPDLVNATDTPNLYRLREGGVNFVNGHAVFPTVTRVNSPSIATGTYPGRAGVVGNSIFIPEIDPTGELNTGDWRVLTELDRVSGGRLLFVESLAERLHAAGKTLAAVSSGSSGSAYLLNHRAQEGVGVLVSGYLEDSNGVVAFPQGVNDAIISRFGAPPPKTGLALEAVNWTQDVLREYVLPEVRPDVVLNWITQPDGAHHSYGTGSPEGLLTIQNDDRNIGLLLDKLRELGLDDETNIFVVSDHGFGLDAHQVNLQSALIDAGLKAGPDSEDVVLASSSHVAAIHVQQRSPRKIAEIVRFLQTQETTGVIFTRPEHGRHAEFGAGSLPGTFSLDLVHLDNAERGADIVVTFDWSSQKNAFGIPGTDTSLTTSGVTGPRTGNASGHGSMSPWTVRNTWFAWGVDFKDAIVNRVPSSNVDIAPTILALQGLDTSALDGRVLAESIEGGPDYEKLPVETRTLLTETGDYRAVIQFTEVGRQRYIDKSWRLP